jgi:predicted secreted Zn-dependent protease
MTDWRRSSFSNNGTCVEIASLPDGSVAVRDSKNPNSPVLSFNAAEWSAFVDGVKAGEFGG